MNFIDDTPVSLSPVQFSKGLLAQLSLLKSQKIGFFTQEEKTAAYAVYEIFDNRVSSIKGNEAKSPRYRELLKIRNTLQPGCMDEYGAFRHAVFQALFDFNQQKQKFPLSNEESASILQSFTPDDRKLIEACAHAYTSVIKKSSKKPAKKITGFAA